MVNMLNDGDEQSTPNCFDSGVFGIDSNLAWLGNDLVTHLRVTAVIVNYVSVVAR